MVRKVSEGLAQAREALEAAHARTPVPLDEDRTTDDVRADMEAMRGRMEAERWALACPRRFRTANLEWIAAEHGQDTHDRLVSWSRADPTPNLVLLGSVGTGKSGSSLAACREGQLERGVGVLFMPVTVLLDELRPGGPEGAMERLAAAPRLIIDDVGSERSSDWTFERLAVLIDRRWLEELPTIVTSNLPVSRKAAPDGYAANTLEDVLGERAFSRLVGGAVVITLTGHDRRRKP